MPKQQTNPARRFLNAIVTQFAAVRPIAPALALVLCALLAGQSGVRAQPVPPLPPNAAGPQRADLRPPLFVLPTPTSTPDRTPDRTPVDAAAQLIDANPANAPEGPSEVPELEDSALEDSAVDEPADPAAEDAATQGYRMTGSLALASRLADGSSTEQRADYEITVAPAADSGAPDRDRRLRLSVSAPDTEAREISVYEIGNAAVTVAGPDQWSVQARESSTPLARSLQPLVDMAALTVASCTDAGESADPGRLQNRAGKCLLVDSEQVAALVAAYNGALRVRSSLLVARLDTARGETLRYLLTAELDAGDAYDAAPSIPHRLEWGYAYEAAPDGAGTRVEWPAAVPRIGEIAAPGFEAGELPAPDRMLALAATEDALHMHMFLSAEEAHDALADGLTDAGWVVIEKRPALLATRGDETVVALLADGEIPATTYVDLVRME